MSNPSGYQGGRGGGGRGGRQPGYRGGGGSGPGRGRGMGGGPGRGRGRGSSDRFDSSTDPTDSPNTAPSSGRDTPTNRNGHGRGAGDSNFQGPKPGHLIPVKPTWPTPSTNIAWRVLYVVPPNSRPELGPTGEKIPGPFSPPLQPSTPEQAASAGSQRPQDVLRKHKESHAMKQRVQQLLKQAADSASGG
ncbi:hypothetical protein GGI18_001976, partial [Coemansia linderi]